MQTESVLVQNLCVPCACRCRYCLLSWDGRPVGIDWERGKAFARRFRDWLAQNRPELRFSFTFGYSMEHPRLDEALRFLREIGSPQASFLQCDGLRMRTEDECLSFSKFLAEQGIRQLNFTFYGLPDYHDRFAGRAGDFELLLRLMHAAASVGLGCSAGIPLTEENVGQAQALCTLIEARTPCHNLSFFIPHEEGRGVSLDGVRLTEASFSALPAALQSRLNRTLYRPEREWLTGTNYREETQRMLLLSLRPDTIERYCAMPFDTLLRELEELDDAYYATFPSFRELAEHYGDPTGGRFYRQRDLYAHYRRLYSRDHSLAVYDVTDERQSGTRRY